MRTPYCLRAIALFLFARVVLGAFEPKVTSNSFDKGSTKIKYFDDSATILNLNDGKLFKSDNNGISWKDISNDLGKGLKFLHIEVDLTYRDRAFIITEGKKQFFTNDKGATWKSFELDDEVSKSKKLIVIPNNNKRSNLLLNFLDCSSIFFCQPKYYYSTDELSSAVKKLNIDDAVFCSFTSTPGNKDLNDDDHVLCIQNEKSATGTRVKSSKVLSSSDWFQSSKVIDNEHLSESLIYDFEVVNNFIVIKSFSDRFDEQSLVNLFVSKDGKNFKKAHFPGDLKSESFSILPSNDHSLYVLVWGFKKKITSHLSTMISDLYVSDSDGHTFKKLDKLSEKKNFFGFHSIEKISNLDGVWLGNIMAGYNGFSFFPSVKSMMSFDDGRLWEYLKYKIDENDKTTKTYCEHEDDCHLNLLNAIEMTGDGSFESGPTPGILLGTGAVSSSQLYDYEKLSTWISRDGGYTWEVAINEPCVFSTGDQGNVIVAIPYFDKFKAHQSADRSLYYYSLDQGKTWTKMHFDKKIMPTLLTTTVDGSSAKFIFSGFDFNDGSINTDGKKFYIYSLDFADAFGGKKCGNGDMEEFYARNEGKDSKSLCIMGHKEKFMRRKQDAKCLVKKLYEDVKSIDEPCSCTRPDYECQRGFTQNDNGDCVPDYKYFREECSTKKDYESRIPKLAKIPGNLCEDSKSDSYQLDKEKDYFNLDCQKVLSSSASKDIKVTKQEFPGTVAQYVYLNQSPKNLKDETIIALTSTKRVYISHNGGVNFFWASLNDEEILAILENRYNGDHVALVTPSKTIYISDDRAQSFKQVKTPSLINGFGYVPVVFHPNSTDTYIFVGSENCETNEFAPDCHSVAYLTTDGGDNWRKLLDNVRTCDFSGARFNKKDDLIICEELNSDRSVKIVSSNNGFKDKKVHFEKAVGFAPDDQFLVVAEIVDDSSALKSLTTVDGETWAHAKFPSDFKVDKEQAYTVIKSNSHSIYLHVTTSNRQGGEFGSILKSNSNGTSYVLSESFVNRDTPGYVDFEKIEGIEGLSIINVVANPEETKKGATKKLKTKITHNDAAEWAYLQPPAVNSKGERYKCVSEGKSLQECSLNLHGFTERVDYRDTYSSGSAVGMLIGVGNVGAELVSRKESSTFLTRDGGVTWKEIYSKPMSWEYGDQGSILVLANQYDESNTIVYSLDEGETWSDFEFTDQKVKIFDLATIPSDTSRRFMVLATPTIDKGDYNLAFGIDFTEVHNRQCSLDLDNLDDVSGDFEYWTPRHPFLPDNCLFGHEARYLRRKPDHHDCFIGNAPLNEAYKVIRNCLCSRRDYECDYNFARASDGTCKLIEGLKPKDPKEVCVNENVFEYHEPTGYRKVPLSTCQGGKEFDKWEPKPCPGKESKFDKQHGSGLNGFNLFLVIFVPISAFVFASWFVYDKGIRRNGGFARFGQIRLEDDELPRVENNFTDKVVNRIVDVGVMAFVGSVALFQFLIKTRKRVADRLRGGSRSRGMGRYATVNQNQAFLDDDDELFGSDEDDDDAGEEDNFISNSDQFDDDARSLSTVNDDSHDLAA